MRTKRQTFGVAAALAKLDEAHERARLRRIADKRREADLLIASQIPVLPW